MCGRQRAIYINSVCVALVALCHIFHTSLGENDAEQSRAGDLIESSRTHLDIITDIAVVHSIQLIVSSSQDGVLKLWK